MHHVIVKGEMAVRAENDRLRAEIDKLRADCNRLRAQAGEPLLEIPDEAVAAQQDATRSFQAGPCKVTIGRLPGATAGPIAAAARGKVAPRGTNGTATSLKKLEIAPAAQSTAPARQDDEAERFALLELGDLPAGG